MKKIIFPTLGWCMIAATSGQTEIFKSIAKAESQHSQFLIGATNFEPDPQKMENLGSVFVAKQLFRGLLRYNTVGIVEPDLADSWTIDSSNKHFTFTLGRNNFSTGEAIVAADVVATFRRMFLEKSAIAADFSNIAGSNLEITSNIEIQKKQNENFGVKAISEKVVAFQLKAPNSIFLQQLASVDCGILKASELTDGKFKVSANTSFSGPYKVVKQDRSEKTPKIYVEKWKQTKEDSKNPPKQVAFIGGTPALQLENIDHKSQLALLGIPTTKTSQIALAKQNWLEVPTDLTKQFWLILNPNSLHKNTRMNIRSVVEKVKPKAVETLHNIKLLHGLIPSTLPGSLKQESFDFENNKPENKKNSKKQIAEVFYAQESEFFKTLVEVYFAPALKGTVIFSPKPLSEIFEKMETGVFDGILMTKGLDYPDGYSILTYFKGGFEQNDYFVNSKEINSLIDDAILETNYALRAELYRKIQNKILSFVTVVPLFEGNNLPTFWSAKINPKPSIPMGFQFLNIESLEVVK